MVAASAEYFEANVGTLGLAEVAIFSAFGDFGIPGGFFGECRRAIPDES